MVSMSFRTTNTRAQQPLWMMMSRLPRYCVNSSAKLSTKQPFLIAELSEVSITFQRRVPIRWCLRPQAGPPAASIKKQNSQDITHTLDYTILDYNFLPNKCCLFNCPPTQGQINDAFLILSLIIQQMERGYLFTLELRVCRQIARLHVYEEDSLNDLINRLSSTVTYKQKYADRLKEKLEAEFKKLLSTQDCSSKVRDKLQSLTEETKLVIVGISQADKNEVADETPFKILLENSANFRKRSVDHPKRQFQYEHESPNLSRKYDKEPVVHYEQRAYHPQLGSYLVENNKNGGYQSSSPTYNVQDYNKYAYNDYQERNNIKDYSPIVAIHSKRSLKPNNQNYQPRAYLGAFQADRRKEGCIRKHNQPSILPYEDTRKDSFQDYKIQKIKSLSALGTHQLRPKYESNPQETYPMVMQQKLVYNRTQEGLKIDYSSKYLDERLPLAARERGKKFSYLSQQI